MRNLIILMLMVTIGSLTSSQQSLVLTYQNAGETVYDTQTPIPLLKTKMMECISNGYLPIVIEGDDKIAWIYLNTLNDPRGYEDLDVMTDHPELEMYLFPITMNKKLKRKLNQGYDKFFSTLGVEYSTEEGEIVSYIDYNRFEKFIY